MGQLDRAGFAGTRGDWAEDHAETGFYAFGNIGQALDSATNAEDLEAADEELFEDDLLSLIAQRPSRQFKQRL
jgi:hypothetical protein